MATPLVDAAARTAIREDLASSLVVEAAAGTGKTTEMIARIIAVIRTGRATLDRIVAVTFTEKAAGEMKLRLRTELERARNAAVGEDVAIERDRLEAALEKLEVARVGTIHSFCTDLLKERPIEARVDPLFEVAAEDEADQLYQQAFDSWFQATLADPPEGVRRLLRRDDPTDLLRDAGHALKERRDFDGAWRRDPFVRDAAIDHVVDELATLGALAAAGHPADPLAKLFRRIDVWIAELGRRDAVRRRDHDGLEAELGKVGRWYEWKYSGRKQLYADGLPRVQVIEQRDAVKAALDALLADAEADLAACLHGELRPLVAEYERLKARAGRLDFLDLLARARDLLRDDRRVRTEMQERFTHFYVDEFQDTDPLQVEILLLLCADDPAVNDASEPPGEPVPLGDTRHARVAPGKLFVVGDPKQAIYRFRRADVAVYETVKRRLLADGARLVHLATSFRSVPSIQAAINAAFEPMMTGEGQASYVPLEHHRADITDQPTLVALPVPEPYNWRGDVTSWAIQQSYPDAVAAFVAHAINSSGWTISSRDTRVPVGARHVCLMFRRFQSFGDDLTRPYVRALEARGIPHILVGGRSFHEREETQAIRNALAAIEWPDDELSVYATLHGPCFALHDEDLLAFKHAHERLHPLHWLDPARVAVLPPGMIEVATALAILGDLHRLRNRRPIADTLARLLATTRAHAGFAVWPAGEQALANVLRVLDLARRFETRSATSSYAPSFRSFVDKLAGDAERGSKQADATVVEDGTEGVRIMTVHAAKGLEFPIVVVCDPTASLASNYPSRHVDTSRRVWLAPIAGCVPVELREQTPEVLRRDREEVIRLTYVAATRARDMLVLPVVGDEQRETWLDALAPVIHPAPATRRAPGLAPGCPPFGDDSVRTRPPTAKATTDESVAPGLHIPKVGTHRVVWWDPRALDLERPTSGGMRQRQILAADEEVGKVNAAESERLHAEWQARRTYALGAGALPAMIVRTVTEAARVGVDVAGARLVHVTRDDIRVDRETRPHGKRFGILVHATLAAVELRADAEAIRLVVANQGRLVGASPDELAAAAVAVAAALRHPLITRAAAASELRREVPVVIRSADGLVEGIVDLAFEDAAGWTVVDFKTDDVEHERAAYEAQIRLYATAISAATGRPAAAALLVV